MSKSAAKKQPKDLAVNPPAPAAEARPTVNIAPPAGLKPHAALSLVSDIKVSEDPSTSTTVATTSTPLLPTAPASMDTTLPPAVREQVNRTLLPDPSVKAKLLSAVGLGSLMEPPASSEPSAINGPPKLPTIAPVAPKTDAQVGNASKAPTAQIAKGTVSADEDAEARALAIRQLQQYLKVFGDQVRSMIPNNYAVLPLQRLQELVTSVDNALGQGCEYAVISSIVGTVATVYETTVMPFVPPSQPLAHAYELGAISQRALVYTDGPPTNPLQAACWRVAIRHTGLFDHGPYAALFGAMYSLATAVGEENLRKGITSNPSADPQVVPQQSYGADP